MRVKLVVILILISLTLTACDSLTVRDAKIESIDVDMCVDNKCIYTMTYKHGGRTYSDIKLDDTMADILKEGDVVSFKYDTSSKLLSDLIYFE